MHLKLREKSGLCLKKKRKKALIKNMTHYKMFLYFNIDVGGIYLESIRPSRQTR